MKNKKSNKKIILAMDSSNSPLQLAFDSEKTGILTLKKQGIKQEEFVFSMINSLLKRGKYKFPDINKFFFIKGPGRFTGIRISLTIASILKEMNNVKISSATVFEALFCQAANARDFKSWEKQNNDGVIACIIHAFREEYFCQIFSSKKAISSPVWIGLEDLKKYLDKINKPVYCVGYAKNKESLENILSERFYYAPKSVNFINPKTMISLAEKKKFAEETLEPVSYTHLTLPTIYSV